MLNGRILKNGKILVHALQWYIGHSCNLTCTNCSNFNNFAISGQDKYSDFEREAQRWSEKLHVNDFGIIGGEPFTNNDLDNWVHGLRDVFTCKDFRVVTNGTLLARHADKMKAWFDKGVTVELSFHSQDHVPKAFAIIDEVLDGKYEKYKVTKNNFIKDQSRHAGCYYEEAILVDDHPAFIINYKDKFMPWGVKNIDNGVYNFYESDREQAHTACWHNDCPYVYKGKMYKCGTVVGAQAFVKKYPVRQQDKDLYESYKPVDAFSNTLEDQVSALSNSIPQCVLCPINSGSVEKISLDKKKVMP